MTISIRQARPEDAAALVELGAAIGREPEAWLLNTDGWRTRRRGAALPPGAAPPS